MTGAEPQTEGDGSTIQDLAPRHDLAPDLALLTSRDTNIVADVVDLVRDLGQPLAIVREGSREIAHFRNQNLVQGQIHPIVTKEQFLLSMNHRRTLRMSRIFRTRNFAN